ncbi:MAG TPA: CHRD domain-containing protein [Myxococcota bacterium]|nr:CHRD domain-containing protein [Myxococcota bacterium]
MDPTCVGGDHAQDAIDPIAPGRESNMHRSMVLFAALAALLLATSAGATQFTINVTLDGAQEGNASPATGSATLILDDVANTLDVNLSYSGLTTALTNAHIHCCSLPPVAAGVIIPFVPPMTTGATSGTFANVFALTPTQVTQVMSGLSYINLHTSTFPGGEIRGQIAAVPEPGTLALMSLGLVGLATARRNARR